MNFKNVNKQMMEKVYETTSTSDIGSLRSYAISVNPGDPIRRRISIDDTITKKMLKNNPVYGYELAVNLAQQESEKVNPAYRKQFEAKLYDDLCKQVDAIFNVYGPYVALKAIEHKSVELSVGNPDEPFSGIIEQLRNLSDAYKVQANKAKKTGETGLAKIRSLADKATGLFSGSSDMQEYKDMSSKLAVITEIDAPLYEMIADGLYNVSEQMNSLNTEIFDVYTSILTEIQRILNKDGQYFSESNTEINGTRTSYSIDILSSGEEKAKRLEKYLDSFISTVSVDDLAQNFIKTMRDNKEKWIAQNNEDDFDVVSEVRTLMDQCLTHNNMKTDIIEKFVTVAYNTDDISAEELDTIWNDNSANSLKMQALTTAAREIINTLDTGARTLAQSTGISFGQFTSQIYIGTLADTPLLSNIISNMVSNRGQTPVTSNAKNKFIVTQRYVNLPMYILKGMSDFDTKYSKNPSDGRHMDENRENWGRFPNPYTIDSVAKDISARNEVPETIYNNADYKILMSVKNNIDKGIDDLYSISLEFDIAQNRTIMKLMDIVKEPNEEEFKEALAKQLKKTEHFNLVEFMKENGYIINEVLVNTGNTDIDLMIRDLQKDVTDDNRIYYQDLPVPISDMYKWIRKSIKYIDIIEKNTTKFIKIKEMMDEINKDFAKGKQFIYNIEVFAFCLRTGLVKQKTPDKTTIWNYMNGKEPVTVNLSTSKTFDKKFYLYHVFAKFTQLEKSKLDMLRSQAVKLIENEEEVDSSELLLHINNILSDEYVGDPFNWETINEEAESLGVTQNYHNTDLAEENPAKDLKRFYELLLTSME
jgi:hypothetical protein